MKKKAKSKSKLEDMDRYIAPCKYCNQDVSSKQSFVAFYSKDYAHYDCMKKDDERRTNDTQRCSN